MVVCADGFVCLGNLPEDRFVAFFVESLKGEEPSEFDTTMSQFMECAKACRKAKLDERAAAEAELTAQVEQLATSKQELESWVESLSTEVNDLETQAIELQNSNTEKDEASTKQIEMMRRSGMISNVYREFDLDGGGDVGEDELLELGQARRRLGHKQGEWTVADNKALMERIGPDEQGAAAVVVLWWCVLMVLCV